MLKLPKLAQVVDEALLDIDTFSYLGKKRRRDATIPLSKLLAVMVWFSWSGMVRWKTYIRVQLPLLLKQRLSYSRWCYWRATLAPLLKVLAHKLCWKKGYRGLAFADSTPLPVCMITRERDHKCFKSHATKSRSSTGWAYGLKLHLLTSSTGEPLRFWLTSNNVHDTKFLQEDMLEGITGRLVTDAGYRNKKNDRFIDQGLNIIVRPYKKKEQELSDHARALFRRRWRIESVFAVLKNTLGLGTIRLCCRRITTFETTVFAALIALTLKNA